MEIMLSIIINHYRTPELLKLCIRSIKKNLASLPHELIVRDGEALEETHDLMREDFPDVTYLPEMENVGFAKLVNDGIRKARGQYILIINADIIITDTASIETLLKSMEECPRWGLVGPKLLNLNDTLQLSCFRFYKPLTLPYRRTFLGRTPSGKKDIARFTYADRNLKTETWNLKPFAVDWLMGSALLARKSAIEKVGLFDERFFMYFEDVDWCRRFWKAGFEVIYHPGAVFYHYHAQASRGKKGLFDLLVNKYTRIHVTSALKYFWKYGLKVPRYGAQTP